MSSPRGAVCELLLGLRMGGAEVLAARIAKRLSGSYRFVFACLDEIGTLGEQLRSEGFPVFVLDRKPGIDWCCSRRLAEIVKREHIDIIHAHQYTPFFYGAAARFTGKRPAIVFTEHGRSFPDYPRPKRILANRFLLRRGDRAIGVGEAVRQALIKNEGIPASRVSVIYNGIDLSAFARGTQDRAVVRDELRIGRNDLVLMQVARLDYLKDHSTAIRTIARVAERRPDAKLVLVGEGPEKEKIEAEIRERKVESNVIRLGLRTDVPRLLAAADIGFLSSVSEGIPLTLIEAMAVGLPVVSTNVGGVTEVVEADRAALLAPSGNDAELADHVLKLGDDRSLRERMGLLGRERAYGLFSEQTMVDAYDRLFQELLRG